MNGNDCEEKAEFACGERENCLVSEIEQKREERKEKVPFWEAPLVRGAYRYRVDTWIL